MHSVPHDNDSPKRSPGTPQRSVDRVAYGLVAALWLAGCQKVPSAVEGASPQSLPAHPDTCAEEVEGFAAWLERGEALIQALSLIHI